jgi:ParB family chromosome partitioning protein
VTDDRGRVRQLGRGLSALLGEERADYASLDAIRQSKTVPTGHLRPNRFQPRRNFDETELESLVASVRDRGVLQPILVRRDAEAPDRYEIVAGERRWRAAQLARLHEVPVIVKDLTDGAALEIALIENIQRQDLNPLEEAEGYRRLMEEFGNTQDSLSGLIGKSRSHIANTVRLLSLPDSVKAQLEAGALTAGHARALLTSADPEGLAKRVVERGLTVRQAERLAQGAPAPGRRPGRPPRKDADTLALERDLSELLGLSVTIRFGPRGGQLVIGYRTLDQLDEVLHRLSAGAAGRGPRDSGGGDPGEPEESLGI